VGVSLSGGDFVGAVISPVVVLCLLNLMAQVNKGQHHEVPDPTPKLKGSRELKNLECSINIDARSHGSNQGKSKKALAVM
jgi:hypothetical protein